MHPSGFDPETSRTVAYNRIANLELPYDTVPHYSIQYLANNYGNNKKAQKHFLVSHVVRRNAVVRRNGFSE